MESAFKVLLSASLFSALSFVVGCGDDGGSDTKPDTSVEGSSAPSELEATPLPPLEKPQFGACNLDFDCAAGGHCFLGRCVAQCSASDACSVEESCSPRGRCTNPNKSADEGEEPSGIKFTDAPGREVSLPKLAQSVQLRTKIAGDQLPATVDYRLEDSEGLVDGTKRFSAPVTDGEVVFEVPVSADDIDELPSKELTVRVSSEAGSFVTVIAVEPGDDAAYGGQVQVSTFGGAPLPFSFEIITDPPNATLEAATTAWLVLPSSAANLFSPKPSEVTSGESWFARPLVLDEVTGNWVATFRHAFPLGDASVIDAGVAANLQRTLRFELRSDAPSTISGTFADTWTGMYDARSAAGVVQPQPVAFSGSFEASRVAAARALDSAEQDVLEAPIEAAPVALPGLEVCVAGMFAASGAPLSVTGPDGTVYSCAGPSGGAAVTNAASFAAADDATRASCAIAVAENALLGDTTGALIQEFFDGDGVTPGNESFSAFMAKCAAGTDGLCRPTAEVLCGRQLLAYAYSAPVSELAASAELVDTYQRVTREAFLGRQLGAFQTDADTRETWLTSSDYPAIVTAALRDFTASLLTDWKEKVLDTHLAVVGGQYDAAGLAMLSRQLTDPDAIAGRQQLLFEMTQSWRGAMESLTLGTQRWNALLFDAGERAAVSDEVATRSLDLYLLAGVASNLNLRGGAGFANASFGSGFGALERERSKLALPFDELIYARDAEVVVSTSLDPQDNNFNLLGRLKTGANTAIAKAATSVGVIISEGTERELSSAQIQSRLNNEANALRDEIISLCGLPTGCTAEEVGQRSGCDVRVKPGECGFAFATAASSAPGQLNVSDAAGAMNAIFDARNSQLIAMAEFDAAEQRAALADARATAFATAIESWNNQRVASTGEIKTIIDQRSAAWSTKMKEIAANIQQRNTVRETLAADAKADAASWNQLRVGGVDTDITKLRAAFGLRRSAEGLNQIASGIERFTNVAISTLPQVVGTANDPSFLVRGALTAKAAYATTIADAAALALRTGAEELSLQRDQAKALREANLSNLREQDIADDLVTQNEIDTLRDQAQLDLSAQQIAELQVDRLIAALQARTAAELAYQRDLTELRDRRDEAKSALVDLTTLSLRIGQSGLGVSQKLLEYLQVVQRAELLSSRLDVLNTQRQNIGQLLGSPAVVFAWANRLAQAESELERAKVALMEWLVGLEYYAVRPFMDQRIQILLARNTYQLEAIAAKMSALEDDCGGMTSTAQSLASVARLAGADKDEVAFDSGESASARELFQARLRRGDVSVDRRLRLSAEVSGNDVATRRDLLSTTIALDIERFANLGSACNAKIVSFDVALVGENLGENLQPTVNIVYDGTSSVRSCQPNITDYVAQFGPGATAFDEITGFRSPARSVSMLAGQGVFPTDGFADGGNRTLSGLPLASNYTVIIDPTLGDNQYIAWENLEDIQLRVNFTYQDFFSEGSKCN